MLYLGGEELSEEFREKAKTVFEAALNSKVSVSLAEDLQAKLMMRSLQKR